jgi:hypothetical protein
MNMSKKLRSVVVVLVVLLVLVLVSRFVLPYGIMPKWASPNCGPEHWRWLGRSFQSRSEVVAYLQEHALELLSGTLAPRPNGAVDWNVSPSDVSQFGQSIAEDIQVESRPGYVIYSLTYHRPACNPGQSYTFKVTSFGLASLYGCCGI